MKSKRLAAPALLLVACQALATDDLPALWASSPLGNCFTNQHQLLSSLFGDDYGEDENILVTAAEFEPSIDRYFWIMDATPKINGTRFLARSAAATGTCIVLYAPFVTGIELRFGQSRALPEEIRTRDAGGPSALSSKVVYRYDPQQKLYRPHQCFSRSAQVSCESVYRPE